MPAILTFNQVNTITDHDIAIYLYNFVTHFVSSFSDFPTNNVFL